MLGDYNIQSLSLNWLRSQMSLVGQEPTLFNTTIFENIVYGLAGQESSLTAQQLQGLVEEAAIKANAHEFISGLPRGYQTEVGEKGTQLSGGQKQRICIARAIIKNPQILLLDEATSALDVRAERSVQKALAAASQGRTTIVIAHRLSTIRDADNIVVMADGHIVEQGTHNELISRNGHYAELVRKQQISSESGPGAEDANYLSSQEKHTEILLDKKSIMDHQNSFRPKIEEEPSLPHPQNVSSSIPSESAQSKDTASSWGGLTNTMKLIGKLSRPESVLTLLATILAVVAGLSVPAYATVLPVMSFKTVLIFITVSRSSLPN